MFVARHRRSPWIRTITGLCRRYLGWYDNASYDLHPNDEAFVVQKLARFEPKVILDVGANVGEWSIEATSFCPTATFYSFEISPPTFEILAIECCWR